MLGSTGLQSNTTPELSAFSADVFGFIPRPDGILNWTEHASACVVIHSATNGVLSKLKDELVVGCFGGFRVVLRLWLWLWLLLLLLLLFLLLLLL